MGDARRAITSVPFIGVSLKMYFGHGQALRWCREVRDLARSHPALQAGLVELAVLPSFTALEGAKEIFAGSGVHVGAQDVFWEDTGAFTGEVSGRELVELGCRYVEIGHAERRRLFAETDGVIRAKVAAAVRNGLTPIVCVGEDVVSTAASSTVSCVSQLEAVLSPQDAVVDAPASRVIVAYEPVWAIGADSPASVPHIRSVCSGIRCWLDRLPAFAAGQVIYGGSAGHGLITALGGSTDGLFLGRFAHDPESLGRILTEVEQVADHAAVAFGSDRASSP